ncbi:MAG: hypothetical protein AAF747_08270 [Planctomycetota bacterium]
MIIAETCPDQRTFADLLSPSNLSHSEAFEVADKACFDDAEYEAESAESLDVVEPASVEVAKPEAADESEVLMSRSQLIDRIVSINTTATASFLAAFDDVDLATYLAHLDAASKPRGREARWSRPADTRAIIGAAADV